MGKGGGAGGRRARACEGEGEGGEALRARRWREEWEARHGGCCLGDLKGEGRMAVVMVVLERWRMYDGPRRMF